MRHHQPVVASGTQANLDIVKGMSQFALPLRTPGNALFPRNRIISRLEQAELEPIIDHRHGLTTFGVAGSGVVETPGELTDFPFACLGYHERTRPENIRAVLLHNINRLPAEMRLPRRICVGQDARTNCGGLSECQSRTGCEPGGAPGSWKAAYRARASA